MLNQGGNERLRYIWVGLQIDYDIDKGQYFVYGTLTMAPKESRPTVQPPMPGPPVESLSAPAGGLNPIVALAIAAVVIIVIALAYFALRH